MTQIIPLNSGRYSRRCRPECKILSWKRSILFMNKICNTHASQQSAEGTTDTSRDKRLKKKINLKDEKKPTLICSATPTCSTAITRLSNNQSHSNTTAAFVVILRLFKQNVKINSGVHISTGRCWWINDPAALISVTSITLCRRSMNSAVTGQLP